MIASLLAAAALGVQASPSLSSWAQTFMNVLVAERSDRVPWKSIFGDGSPTADSANSGFTDFASVTTDDRVRLGMCVRTHPVGKAWVMHCGGASWDGEHINEIGPFSSAITIQITDQLRSWRSGGWVPDHDGNPEEIAERYVLFDDQCDQITIRRFTTTSRAYPIPHGSVTLTYWGAPNKDCTPITR